MKTKSFKSVKLLMGALSTCNALLVTQYVHCFLSTDFSFSYFIFLLRVTMYVIYVMLSAIVGRSF